jgi:hypothetical protein
VLLTRVNSLAKSIALVNRFGENSPPWRQQTSLTDQRWSEKNLAIMAFASAIWNCFLAFSD